MQLALKDEEKLRRLDIASRVVMKYGPLYSRSITSEMLREILKEVSGSDDFTLWKFRSVKASHIKWYIRNKLEIDDAVWNGDFLAGIVKAGKVSWHITNYPTFRWWGAEAIALTLKDCPYYGTLITGKKQKQYKRFHLWKKVPALYLEANTETKSYLAGLLATGKHHYYEGVNYALYKNEVMEEIEKFGILMDKPSFGKPRSLISPFWPALFTRYMPESTRSYWLDLKKPYMGEEYASILWFTYGDYRKVKKRALPYLPSRRKVLYKFKSDKGTIKELQRLRVTYNLVDLDKRVNECIVEWFNDA